MSTTTAVKTFFIGLALIVAGSDGPAAGADMPKPAAAPHTAHAFGLGSNGGLASRR